MGKSLSDEPDNLICNQVTVWVRDVFTANTAVRSATPFSRTMWPTLLFAAPCLGSPMDGFLRPVFGSACLPLDVRSFLTSDIREAVTQQCASLVEGRGTRVCSAECRDAVLAFRGHRCYSHLSQSQRRRSRLAHPRRMRTAPCRHAAPRIRAQ